jgi:leucyl/phenylalanyl-tRNA--protein transferase
MTLQIPPGLTVLTESPEDAEGLAAIGGSLSIETLLFAYHSGMFPWLKSQGHMLWFSPDPRLVLFPDDLKIADSLKRIIKSKKFTVTWDKDFPSVINNCKDILRGGEQGTWITQQFRDAYIAFHEAGHAHSVEVWEDDELVGGLYGVVVGKCFCGESMFSQVSNASKVAFVWLAEKLKADGFAMIDCQLPTDHLKGFGAIEIPKDNFLQLLSANKTP